MVLIATQVKRRRGTTAENDAFTGAEGEITVDTEKHQLRVHDGMTQGGFVIGSGGSGRNVGDRFITTRLDNELNGAVECDGATYNTEDYTGAGSIGELLEAGKLDYVSLTAYATAISTKGWCDKIGWNGAGTTSFRVPTLTPHIIQKNNIPVKGTGMSLGLTNGTSNAGAVWVSGAALDTKQSQYGQPVSTAGQSSSGSITGVIGITTDSTKSGMIADTSDTAQPRVMIQLFNGATDEAVATCTGVLADVADLKDMSNITATGKETVVGWGVPDYNAGVDISTTAGNSFTMPVDALVYINAGGSSRVGVYKDNASGARLSYLENTNSNTCTDHFLAQKGTVLYIAYRNGSYTTIKYFPLKGVQNA